MKIYSFLQLFQINPLYVLFTLSKTNAICPLFFSIPKSLIASMIESYSFTNSPVFVYLAIFLLLRILLDSLKDLIFFLSFRKSPLILSSVVLYFIIKSGYLGIITKPC